MVPQLTMGVTPTLVGYYSAMSDTHTPRRILVTAGIVLASLIVAVAAVYAVAFLILAPMMQ